METIDAIVIGGGVVGLAIARALSRHLQVCVLEQEKLPGTQTSSRNSGVIHAGLYYPQHFLKSTLCIEGRQKLYQYCRDHNIAHQACGKLLLAVSNDEIGKLKHLQQQAASLGVRLDWLSAEALAEKEPQVQAKAALYSAASGIIDSSQYMLQLQADIEQSGSFVACQQQVTHIECNDQGFSLEINHSDRIQCCYLINAAGLQAQTIAKMIGTPNVPPLYYCKGQYFSWQAPSPFSHLIYPMPLANNQGLGVHATLDLAGRVRFGPDAHYIDSIDYQNDDSARAQFAAAIRPYFPVVSEDKLQADYCGVRPKLSKAGEPMQDFVIQDKTQHGIENLIQLFGIESPGLTASLSIADYVSERLRT